ncbi:putative oxidoreductase [Scopulibacillus darangshiensis]|uniref:Putative oxidoreductase n=1 Tax=Scopulibacillus darangshiensis TaxID=442528 RepID=A0A4R2NDY7_9BACL|nr:DoxX family protein [Scopulibacillus darangshiensis]TCP19295.1 putative oxidoreductase [Scopulibacillus darangshiensis]
MLTNLALLLIRLVVGLIMAGHGSQKLFGWFGGHGLKGTAGFFESIKIKPGYLMALLAGLGEFAGGLLFAAGVFTWIGALLIIVTMFVALITVHRKAFWVTSGGFEYNLILIVVALAVALTGPGSYVLFHL